MMKSWPLTSVEKLQVINNNKLWHNPFFQEIRSNKNGDRSFGNKLPANTFGSHLDDS
jgi:hypothetical protein